MPKTGSKFWYGVGAIGVLLIAIAVFTLQSPSDDWNPTPENPPLENPPSENTPSGQNQTENFITTDTVVIPDVVLAKVNGEEIKIEDFQARVRMERTTLISEFSNYIKFSLNPSDPNYQQQYDEVFTYFNGLLEPESLGQTVLNTMIDDILIMQEAKSRGIEVTEEETIELLQSLFGYYPNGYPTFTPAPTIKPVEGEEPIQIPTVLQPTSITEDEYNQGLENYLNNYGDIGFTKETLLSIIEAQLLGDKLSHVLAEGISNEEDQVHARHILVADLETAESVLERLDNGEAWEDLALELSIDISNSSNGGDLGWFSEGTMVPEFNDAAFSGEVGTIVGPIKTQFGFHLIEILGHELRPLPEQEYDYQVRIGLTNLIGKIRIQAEDDGRIELIDNWLDYVPDDPKMPESNE